jgi:hypothetical protein
MLGPAPTGLKGRPDKRKSSTAKYANHAKKGKTRGQRSMKKKSAPVRAIRVKGFAVACALVAENS